MVRLIGTVLVVSLALLFSSSFAHANSAELLTFDGLQNNQLVGNFYNGGGMPSTPNYGVSFSSNVFALLPVSRGGTGDFAPDPTASPAIFFNGIGANVTGTMNVANGFSSGINFFYTAAFTETVKIWSGANGTGTVLATMTLAANDGGCSPPAYCHWTNVGLALPSGATAGSVTFTGMGNGAGIADITLGQSITGIPEPSSIYLLGTGLMGLCSQRMRRLLGM